AVAGMDMGVDEAWAHEFALGIDDAVDAAFESFSDVEDPVVLEDDLAVAQERVMTALMAHHPRRLDPAAHAVFPQAELATLERIGVNGNRCEPRTRSYPPPCGEGGDPRESGGSRVEVVVVARGVSTNCDPHPQPLPTRGRGADRVCRSRFVTGACDLSDHRMRTRASLRAEAARAPVNTLMPMSVPKARRRAVAMRPHLRPRPLPPPIQNNSDLPRRPRLRAALGSRCWNPRGPLSARALLRGVQCRERHA